MTEAKLTLKNSSLETDLASHIGRFHGVGLRNKEELTDTKIICQDGTIRAHQVMLGFGSSFLKRLFLGRHTLEFEVIDFKEASALLLDRHAARDDVTLMLPDFTCDTVNRILDFLYSGQCFVKSKQEVETFKGVFKSLKIDAFTVKNLQVTNTAKIKPPLPPAASPAKLSQTNTQPKAETAKPEVKKNAKKEIKAEAAKGPGRPKASGSAAPKVATSAAKATGGAAKATGGAAKATGGAAKTAAKATAGAAKAVASNKAAGSAENGSATQGIVCPICDQTLSTRKGKQDINRYRYTEHILTHVQDSLFDDVPILDRYACPHPGCTFQAESSTMMIQHLCRVQHNELLPRIERRFTEVNPNDPEYSHLLVIKKEIMALAKNDHQPSEWQISTELQILDAYDKSFAHDKYNCLICKAKFGTCLGAIHHYVYTHNHKYCSPSLSPIMRKAAAANQQPAESGDPRRPRDTFTCREPGCRAAFSTHSKCKLIGHLAKHHRLFEFFKLPVVITGGFEYTDVPFTETFQPPPKNPAVSPSQTGAPQSSKDSYSCSNCCQHFGPGNAEAHFKAQMHFNGNIVKCVNCDDTTGAKVKNYPDFVKYHQYHVCNKTTGSQQPSSASVSGISNSNSLLTGPSPKSKRPPEGGHPRDDDSSKRSRPDQLQSSPTMAGSSPPPGLLVTGRDCIEIEIDSD